MTKIKSNFRGLRALVLQSDSGGTDRLTGILERLGLVVLVANPQGLSRSEDAGLPPCDLVLFDADEEIDATLLDPFAGAVPMIALIGNEAPSRLARVVRFGCHSHILKPIRSMGVYSALILATNGHERHEASRREMEALRQRLAGRRLVMKAVLKRMTADGVDEDVAYEELRRRAMELRISLEEAARRSLGWHDLQAIAGDQEIHDVRGRQSPCSQSRQA